MTQQPLGGSTHISREHFSTWKDDRIPEAEQNIIAEEVKTLTALMEGALKAKYTVRLTLEDGPRMEAVVGFLQVFAHKGREFVDSQMEEKLYFCPGKGRNRSNCDRLMPALSNASTSHTCPFCGITWKGEEVYGELKGRLSRQNWIIELTRLVETLNREVQVEVRVYEPGIRDANNLERERSRGGEALAKARKKKLEAQLRFPNLVKALSLKNGDLQACMAMVVDAASSRDFSG